MVEPDVPFNPSPRVQYPQSTDLSGGSVPEPFEEATADERLRDTRARRRFRLASITLAIGVIAMLAGALLLVVEILTSDAGHVTAPAVGMVVTLTVALSFLTIAVLRSTFTAEGDKGESDTIPTPSGEALKLVGSALEAVGKALSTKAG